MSVGPDWIEFSLLVLGLFFLVQGILMRLGLLKYWFATKPVSTLVIPDFAFGFIPLGLGALIIVTGTRLEDTFPSASWSFDIGMVIALSSLVFTLWQPRWLKPAWYRWLEDNYGEIMPLLRKDAQSFGRMKWQRMVRTQKGLEEWAERVYQRYKSNPTPIYG